MKLSEFHVQFGGQSPEEPSCCEVSYSATFLDAQGQTRTCESKALVYDGLLDDPQQLPWVIAHQLQALYKQK